jgi:hypothetical protein
MELKDLKDYIPAAGTENKYHIALNEPVNDEANKEYIDRWKIHICSKEDFANWCHRDGERLGYFSYFKAETDKDGNIFYPEENDGHTIFSLKRNANKIVLLHDPKAYEPKQSKEREKAEKEAKAEADKQAKLQAEAEKKAKDPK